MSVVVEFANVTKRYPLYNLFAGGYKAFISELPFRLRKLRRERFTALEKISFKIAQGESVAGNFNIQRPLRGLLDFTFSQTGSQGRIMAGDVLDDMLPHYHWVFHRLVRPVAAFAFRSLRLTRSVT